jgi:hypothetical protein
MQVSFLRPFQINVVLVGFLGDIGGYYFNLDGDMLQECLKKTFLSHWPPCLKICALFEIER